LAEIRLPPTLLKVYEWMRAHACEHWTRREVAEALGISYSTARYALEELATRGLITRHIAWPPRRIFYHAYPPLPPALPPLPPPPPKEEYIGDEETTGYDIFYNVEEEKYKIRDPTTIHVKYRYPPYRPSEELKIPEVISREEASKFVEWGYAEWKLVRTEDKLLIEVTCSLEGYMEGHDVPITLELTGITLVEKMGISDIALLTARNSPIEKAVFKWLEDMVRDRPLEKPGWTKLIKSLIGTIDYAFMGQSEEPKRKYECPAPDYKKIGVWLERKSRYIPYRKYPTVGCDIIEAIE
jgi:DNA-binding Lrp family transcriptional regulator